MYVAGVVVDLTVAVVVAVVVVVAAFPVIFQQL